MSRLNWWQKECPYCGCTCEAEFVDVGVGQVQVTPFVCNGCRATEIGAYDEPIELSSEEERTGFYKGLDFSMEGHVALIVEGHSDAHKVLGALSEYNICCIVTGGTKFDNKTKAQIHEHRALGNKVYILSDPDSEGDRIADMIHEEFPHIERINANPEFCQYFTGKRFKEGIEYASYSYIRNLLIPYLLREEEIKTPLDLLD